MDAPPLDGASRGGRGGWLRGGPAEVADGAGGFPGVGEAGAGLGFAEAEDEAVHLGEEGGDLAEPGPEGGGERLAAGNGGGGIGDESLEVGGFLGKEGGIRRGEAVFGKRGGVLREGGSKGTVEEAGAGDKLGIEEALPAGERKGNPRGIGLPALVFKPIGEGFGDFVGGGVDGSRQVIKMPFIPDDGCGALSYPSDEIQNF